MLLGSPASHPSSLPHSTVASSGDTPLKGRTLNPDQALAPSLHLLSGQLLVLAGVPADKVEGRTSRRVVSGSQLSNPSFPLHPVVVRSPQFICKMRHLGGCGDGGNNNTVVTPGEAAVMTYCLSIQNTHKLI